MDSEESKSEKCIIGILNENSEESQFVINEEQLTGLALCKTGLQSTCKAWIGDHSTENTKLKLIGILKGKAIVLKQR